MPAMDESVETVEPVQSEPEDSSPKLSKIDLFNAKSQSKVKPTPLRPGQKPSVTVRGVSNPSTPKQSSKNNDNDDNFAENVLEDTNNFFSNFNVTSGLALAFVVLIFLIWTLIPTASGYTRLQLLWFTIIGETHLKTDNSPQPTTDVPQTTSEPSPIIPLTTTTDTSTQQVIQYDLSGLEYL